MKEKPLGLSSRQNYSPSDNFRTPFGLSTNLPEGGATEKVWLFNDAVGM
jgi:hypothetical protein